MNRREANAEKTNLGAVEEVAELQRRAFLDIHSLCQNLSNTPELPISEADSAVPNLRRIRTKNNSQLRSVKEAHPSQRTPRTAISLREPYGT